MDNSSCQCCRLIGYRSYHHWGQIKEQVTNKSFIIYERERDKEVIRPLHIFLNDKIFDCHYAGVYLHFRGKVENFGNVRPPHADSSKPKLNFATSKCYT